MQRKFPVLHRLEGHLLINDMHDRVFEREERQMEGNRS